MTRQNLKDAGARVGVAVSLSRVLQGGAVVALALIISGVLAGCALVGESAQSEQSSAAGAEQAMSATVEKVMSGEYEVGPDGKLLNPNKDLTPPQLPELAKEHSKEGAEAFVRYYLELLPYAAATGDVAPLKKVAHSDCKSCVNTQKGIVGLYDEGGWVKPVVNEVESIGPAFEIPDHPGIWNVDIMNFHDSNIQYNGETLEENERTIEKMHFQLQYVHGQWLLWAVGRG